MTLLNGNKLFITSITRRHHEPAATPINMLEVTKTVWLRLTSVLRRS